VRSVCAREQEGAKGFSIKSIVNDRKRQDKMQPKVGGKGRIYQFYKMTQECACPQVGQPLG
jgi:hypothetical protein